MNNLEIKTDVPPTYIESSLINLIDKSSLDEDVKKFRSILESYEELKDKDRNRIMLEAKIQELNKEVDLLKQKTEKMEHNNKILAEEKRIIQSSAIQQITSKENQVITLDAEIKRLTEENSFLINRQAMYKEEHTYLQLEIDNYSAKIQNQEREIETLRNEVVGSKIDLAKTKTDSEKNSLVKDDQIVTLERKLFEMQANFSFVSQEKESLYHELEVRVNELVQKDKNIEKLIVELAVLRKTLEENEEQVKSINLEKQSYGTALLHLQECYIKTQKEMLEFLLQTKILSIEQLSDPKIVDIFFKKPPQA